MQGLDYPGVQKYNKVWLEMMQEGKPPEFSWKEEGRSLTTTSTEGDAFRDCSHIGHTAVGKSRNSSPESWTLTASLPSAGANVFVLLEIQF